MDELSKEVFSRIKLNNMEIVTLSDLGDRELNAIRNSRSPAEFSWTCKPTFMEHVMDKAAIGDVLNYLDADLFFFSSPKQALEDVSPYSIAITPHDFSVYDKGREKLVGVFNAGVIFFKKGDTARRCLEKWRSQCIEWCFARLDDGKLADQMYLDEWPELYGNDLTLMTDSGINVGSWNIANYHVRIDKDAVYIDKKPLISFHFHHFKTYFSSKGMLFSYPILTGNRHIFGPYMEALRHSVSEIRSLEIPGLIIPVDKNPGLARLIKQHIIKLWQTI